MKRTLAVFLICCLLCSILPLAAQAEEIFPEELLEEPLLEEELIALEEEEPLEELIGEPFQAEELFEEETIPEATYGTWEAEVEEGVFHGYSGPQPLPVDADENEISEIFAYLGVYDTDFPSVADFQITEAGKFLRPGDEVHFKVKFTDKNGIDHTSIYFGTSQSNDKYISLEKNERTGYYEGSYIFKDTDPAGEYYIASASAYDIYGFYTSFHSSYKRVMQRFFPGSVYLRSDYDTAEIFSNVTFTETGKTLKPGDVLHLSFDVDYPKGARISYLYATFYGRGISSSSIRMEYSSWRQSGNTLSYDEKTGHVTGTYTLTKDLINGEYYLSSISLSGENYTSKNFSSNLYTFTMTGGQEPAASSISVSDIKFTENGKTLKDGDTLHFSFRVKADEELRDTNLYLHIVLPESDYNRGVTYSASSKSIETVYDAKSGLYKGEYTLQKDDVYGVYEIDQLYVYGKSGGSASVDCDFMFRFGEKGNETFRRLDPATNLNWTSDGYLRFTLPSDLTGLTEVRVEVVDDSGDYVTSSFISNEGDLSFLQTTGSSLFMTQNLKAGNYYFTVQLEGDGETVFNSTLAKSGAFRYTVPSAKLGNITGLTWEQRENYQYISGKFTMPSDKTYLGGYRYNWFFSATKNGTPAPIGYDYYRTFEQGEDKTFGYIDLYDSLLQENGSGYYYYKVCAKTSNAVKSRDGDWSSLSSGQFVSVESDTTFGKLNAIETEGKTPQQIRAQVQQIGTEALSSAMHNYDNAAAYKIRELESAVGASMQIVVNSNAPALLRNGFRAFGGGLNDVSGVPTLTVGASANQNPLPANFNHAAAIRFSMQLSNVANPAALKVPVMIDVPVPNEITYNRAYLLQLSDSGSVTSIYPVSYLAGEQNYAQFVLTSIGGDYALTQNTPVDPTPPSPPTPPSVDSNIYNFVYRCYSEALGRTEEEIQADADGVMYWYNNIKDGLISADYVGYYFVFSPEGASKGQSNNNFVTMLYRLYMNRIPDEGGLNYWDELLNSGTLTRENVNWWFCESDEWQGIKAEYGMK